jgi:NAD-dependent SIR2 family protein deacetylase
MKLGESISKIQRELLQEVKREPTWSNIFEALLQLTTDSDILKGKENVHPDWVKIYDSQREMLTRYLPQKQLKNLGTFFKKLVPFYHAFLTLDPEKLKIAFLLGAGASKPTPSNIPTVKELLPQLLERARRLDRDDVTKLSDFCDDRKIDNIEDLLTAAQLATFCSRNSTVWRLINYLLYRRDSDMADEDLRRVSPLYEPTSRYVRRRVETSAADVSSVAFLQDTLQVLFGLLASTMLPAKPNKAHEAIALYSTKHPKTAIVTTNYDCCIDLALEDVKQPFQYRIEFVNRPVPASTEKTAARLVKLHGSLNWYYCETCQEVQLVDIRAILKGYLNDQAPYPVIAICKECGGQRRGLLVPPLAMKFDVAPPLTPLLGEARDAFEKADLITVVGFSFAEADIYISRMLSKSMQSRSTQKLLIVDPDADVVSRVRRKFKASIPNFKENRIIHLSGDCAEMLPKFLAGELREKAQQKEESVQKRTTKPKKQRAEQKNAADAE